MADRLNIYQRLAKVRKQIEVIQKNKSGYGYKYVSEDEILSKLSGYLDKYELILIPEIVEGTTAVTPYHTVKTKVAKNGDRFEEHVNDVLVSADMKFTWVCTDNPEDRLVVPWSMVGQQSDASQAGGSGLTYYYRYMLLKFFGIATPDDDPDNWRSKQKEAVASEDKSIAAEIISQFDEHLRVYMSDHPEKNDEVREFVSKFAKNGNYRVIKEPKLAAKLFEDFKKQFN